MSARDCPCAECTAQRNALLGQARAVFEHVESELSEPNEWHGPLERGERWDDERLQWPQQAPLAPPDTSADLLTMHLRAMCAVVRGLAGYLPYEQQLALWAAEEACRG